MECRGAMHMWWGVQMWGVCPGRLFKGACPFETETEAGVRAELRRSPNNKTMDTHI